MNKAYELAKSEIGTVEWKNGDNPVVVGYFADSGNAGVKNDETAWCAAFVGAMLRRAGMKSTGALNARSYLDWGTPVDRKDAMPGDVVIFKRGNSSWQGHVAFFVKDRGKLLDVLGGNQSDAVNIKGYSAAALLGIRRPTGAKAKAPTPAKVPDAITRLGYKTVKEFQKARGLEVDGIVGPKTTAAMNAARAAKKPAPVQKRTDQEPIKKGSATTNDKGGGGASALSTVATGAAGGGVILAVTSWWQEIKATLAAWVDFIIFWN